MRYSKFILLRVLIDLFFVVSIVFIYVKGSEGSLLIRNLPLNLLIIIVVFLSIKNIRNRAIPELVGEGILTVLLFKWYVEATEDNYDILASDFWFINILRGLILLMGFYFILDVIKRYLNSFTKSAQIFYVANSKENYSIAECFIGATIRFKSTVAIPVFNKLLRDCIGEIIGIARKNLPSAEETENKIDDFFSEIANSRIGTASRFVLKSYADYVDECVLVYCYMHPEKSLIRSAIEAMSIFVTNAVKIIEKMAVVIIMQALIKIGIGGAIIVMLFKTAELTVRKLLLGFIVIKMFEFILQDAILEPLMMQKILSTFTQLEPSQKTAKEILDKFPILNKIKKLQSTQDPEDLDSMESTPVQDPAEVPAAPSTEQQSLGEGVDMANDQYKQEEENKERNTLL